MVDIKKFLKYSKDESLVRDSLILFAATMIANLSGFLYHFVMGRILGPADYGILGVGLSLFYILLVPLFVIQMSISKFVSKFKARDDKKSIDTLYRRSLRKILALGLVFTLAFVLLSFFLSNYLKTPIIVLWIVALAVPFVLLLSINRGLLQGMQDFRNLGKNFIAEALTKFIVGVVLTVIGLGVFGAVFGMTASYIFAFIFSFIILKKYRKKNNKKLDSKIIYKYSVPVLIALLSLTLFYSLDIIMVKHYFNDINAGYYAAFSLLGRIAFFASLAIVFVLFPKVSEMHELGKANIHLLKKAMVLISIVCGVIILGYLMFPKLVVLVLFGSQYLSITKYIAVFAVIMALFSYVYLISFYNLSINRTGFVYYLTLLNIAEVLLLIKFHNSLWQVTIVLLTLISITFIFMLLYTFRKNGKNINSNTSIQ